jgi:hypothetical protein
MARLEFYYQRQTDETLGDVVPREALDPNFDFNPERTQFLIDRFLADLSRRTNPFLSSPEKMLEGGFVGTPYVFDMEADRQYRAVL